MQSADRVSSDKDSKALALEFSERLRQAIANSPHIPEHFSGQQTWIAREMKRLFGISVTSESVRKWVHGEIKPREPKALKLAELFNVDPVWLYHGIESPSSSSRRTVQSRSSNGAANIVAGMIQMDGGAVAFTQDEDSRSDLMAIIQGQTYSISVVAGEWSSQLGQAVFQVPEDTDGVTVLGLMRSGSSVTIVRLEEDLIAAGRKVHVSARSTRVEVTLDQTEVRRRLVPSFRTGV